MCNLFRRASIPWTRHLSQILVLVAFFAPEILSSPLLVNLFTKFFIARVITSTALILTRISDFTDSPYFIHSLVS